MNISVIIPVYNAEKFLQKTVDSALQFPEVKEILLVEDKSTDHSLQVCNEIVTKNARVKLLQHADKGNHGAAASRNLGIQEASQEFIAFLDADDYFLPNRFDAERMFFENPIIDGVFGAIGTEFHTDSGKKQFEEKFGKIQLTTVKYHAEGMDVFYGLSGHTEKPFGLFFHLDSLTVRRSALLKSKIRFNEKLRVHQDSDFIIKLSFATYLKSGIIDQAIAIRGVHDDNRITKIGKYSDKFYENMFKLYDSKYEWSLENNIPQQIKKSIKLSYLAFKIANETGSKKYFNFLTTSIKHPEFLKLRYRFHALREFKKK